jgi:hypothetical protein
MQEAGTALANTSSNKILMGLADRPGEDMTARLLLALTALYVERPTHTGEEEQQYVELVLRLIGKVDATTRGKVADLLGCHAGAPAEILARLDAAPSAQAIPPAGAVEVATADWPAEPAAERAAEMPAPSSHGAGSARGEPADASAAAPPAELGEVFFAGNAAERRQVLVQITALAADDDGVSPQPASPDDARAFAGLDAAAMDGRIGEFLREFERLLSAPKGLCERILNDRSGEPMVIAAKAANMPIAVLQRILLLVNPAVGHSVQRVFDLSDLFHDIERHTAVKLLSLWRAQAPDVGVAATSEPSDNRSVGVREGAGLRSRFGALADRIRIQDGKGVSAPPIPGNAARRDLRSR